MKLRAGCLRGGCLLMAAFALLVFEVRGRESELENFGKSKVGRLAPNRYLTPSGQILTPAGRQVDLPGFRPQAVALSPDGRLLATSGKANALVIIDSASGEIRQMVPLSTNQPQAVIEEEDEVSPEVVADNANSQQKTNVPPSSGRWHLSLTGMTFSPDGKRIYVSSVGGRIRVYGVTASHRVVSVTNWAVPNANAPKQRHEIPAGLAVSADGRRLYVVGNLGNKLDELDAQTGNPLRSWPVGVAPYEVVLVGNKAYVSNLGGRRPGANDLKAPAGKGTSVRVDPVRHIPNEGSVTVIDLSAGRVKTEIMVELHPSAMAVSPNQRYVVVANTGSDTLSVIDVRTDQVVEKIWARQTPADLFGAQPNAVAFDRKGEKLYVCNGTQNAVAVIRFDPADKESKMLGLIPVGWFPGAIAFDGVNNLLHVANIKGIGSTKNFKEGEKIQYSTKQYYGTVSIVPVPSDAELAALTQTALLNMRYPQIKEAFLPPRPDQPPRPVPERTGEPSVFKHVLYVIKENRSYDQVLGDMPEGNGASNLCVFGERYTPNQHKIAREFVLLDNTYCAGIQSADGHQWTDSGIANEYVERQVTTDFPRSYPGGKVEDGIDALAWASSGFIWDHVIAHGKTFRNYGEWMISECGWSDPRRHSLISWTNYLNDFLKGTAELRIASRPGIESLRKYSKLDTVGWNLKVPDIVRADRFIKELKQFEVTGGLPDLMLLFLPNDHTGGASERYPRPGSHVADNDLAFGRVVEAVSHSKFWPQTVIFCIEDDPQSGWDHVSGYRTTCFVVSPYTKRRQTISTHYNQLSLLRTIELILGVPPMNQLDASACPMTDCFQDTPDFTPFTSVTNRYPLDRMNPGPRRIANRQLRRDAELSNRLPLDEPDKCPEDVLNRILWRAMKGPDEPYPEWAVSRVEDDD